MEKKTIFDYDNYRDFLRAAYEELKARNPHFSYRYFSRVAGFRSSSVLKEVMEGRSNIALHSIPRFAKALKLGKEEAIYFHHLVLMNQAKTVQERHAHAEHLATCRKSRELRPLVASQFNYYKRWYSVPIRELVGTPDFREDPEWIARQLSPSISSTEAALALSDLLRLGLIHRDSEGRLRPTEANISTGDEVISAAIALWHQEMLKKAAESIDRHPRQERDISALTVCVSTDTMSRLKQMIQAFRKTILEECSRETSPDRVYHLGFQLFPLSKKPEDV